MNLRDAHQMGWKAFRYLWDPDVPLWRRMAGVWAVLYFLSPLDAVPDFIPLLGMLDDAGVLGAAAVFLMRELRKYEPQARGSGSLEDPTLRRVS